MTSLLSYRLFAPLAIRQRPLSSHARGVALGRMPGGLWLLRSREFFGLKA